MFDCIVFKDKPLFNCLPAITMYELHATMVQLAKKLFDGREITGAEYLVRIVYTEIIFSEFVL